MKTAIDSIMGSFLPAMKRIEETSESDERKQKRAEAWLESKLKELATSVFEDILKAPAIAHDTARVGSETELGWEKRGPAVRECLVAIARNYGVEVKVEPEPSIGSNSP